MRLKNLQIIIQQVITDIDCTVCGCAISKDNLEVVNITNSVVDFTVPCPRCQHVLNVSAQMHKKSPSKKTLNIDQLQNDIKSLTPNNLDRFFASDINTSDTSSSK